MKNKKNGVPTEIIFNTVLKIFLIRPQKYLRVIIIKCKFNYAKCHTTSFFFSIAEQAIDVKSYAL